MPPVNLGEGVHTKLLPLLPNPVPPVFYAPVSDSSISLVTQAQNLGLALDAPFPHTHTQTHNHYERRSYWFSFKTCPAPDCSNTSLNHYCPGPGHHSVSLE